MLKLSISNLQTFILICENISLFATCIWVKCRFSPTATPEWHLSDTIITIVQIIVLTPCCYLLYLSHTKSIYSKLFNISHTPIHNMLDMLLIVPGVLMYLLASKYSNYYKTHHNNRNNKNQSPKE